MELLIRVHDKDSDRRHRMCERGDVVVVCPDGWAWSEKEKTLPCWRILRVDMSEAEAIALTAPEVGIGGRRRAIGIDLSALPQEWLNDDLRRRPIAVGTIRRVTKTQKAGPKNVI